ncbi:MAG: hypothetical protein CME06_12625, partial [Gemmatimonadetes bacterium]|nr:hypothetical protein [Gemmatimonadota bacterium]
MRWDQIRARIPGIGAMILATAEIGVAGARTIDVPAEHASIQDAIGAAVAGDTVLVQPGSYAETIDLIGKAIVLTGTDPGDWAVVAATVVDASAVGGSVLTLATGEGSATAVRGFLLRGGTGTEWELPALGRAGGGIYCEGTQARIERCIVRGNSAEGGREHGRGAGMYCTGGAAPAIQECVVDSNLSTGDSGGIFCTASAPTISDCTISDNLCVDSGCGLYCRQGAAPTIEGCVISGNYAHDSGAGIYCKELSTPTIRDCTISNNEAVESGGGIKCKTGAAPWILECVISGNRSTGAGAESGGGGLYCIEAAPVVSGCTISGNEAVDYGGGVACIEASAPAFDDCALSGNTVSRLHGGGLFAHRSSATLRRCVIEGNNAGGSGGGFAFHNGAVARLTNCVVAGNSAADGGGLDVDDADFDALNCTIAGNDASGSGGGVRFDSRWRRGVQTLRSSVVWGNLPDEIEAGNGSPVVEYCDIGGGWIGAGNIDADPLFRDAAAGDYRLAAIACGGASDSPSIDASDPRHGDTVRDCSTGLGAARADQGAYGGPGVRGGCGLDAFLSGAPATILLGDTLTLDNRLGNLCTAARSFDRVQLRADGPASLERTLYAGPGQSVAPGSELSGLFTLPIPLGAPLGTYTLTLYAELESIRLCADVARMTIARPLRVPAEHASIAAAISAASSGDVIIVAPGTYAESGLDFGGKSLTLRSVAPNDSAAVATTVIDGGGAGPVIRFAGSEGRDALVSGLTIRNGAANRGGAVQCSNASPTLAHCVMTGNSATGAGGAIHAGGGAPRIEQCTLSGNGALTGAAIAGEGASFEIVTSRLSANAATGDGGALSIEQGGETALLGCLLDASTAAGLGGA